MSDTVWVATIALGMAIVNMTGSVLMLWIRAAYRWREIEGKLPNGSAPPPG